MQENVIVVLVQPQDIVNVAGVIRVMANFGLRRLRLVEPAAFDPYRIEGIAHHTEEIVQATERFATLADAVRDCRFIIGSTGRPRAVDRERLTPAQAAPLLLAGAANGRVAVLFGRETDGLTSAELDLCHALVTVPTSSEKRSLNLAQAALVVCYELFQASIQTATAPEPQIAAALRGEAPASAQETEPIFGALEQILRALHPNSPDTRAAGAVARLRSVLLRACPRPAEAEALTRLFLHIAARLRDDAAVQNQ